MNAERPAGATSVSAGEIVALGLLHEVGHLLIAPVRAGARGRPPDPPRAAPRPSRRGRAGAARAVHRGVPRPGRGAGAAAAPGRGARARARREREPRARRAEGARGRHAARAGDALSRGDRGTRTLVRRRRRGRTWPGGRSSSCCAPRRATPRRR
jgi:hypothetical protein